MYKLLIIFLLLPTISVLAQDTTKVKPSLITSEDSLKIAQAAAKDTLITPDRTANKALVWGLIPGGGQIYNKQYWKAPIFIGGMTAFTALAIERNSAYKKRLTDYNKALGNSELETDIGQLRADKNKALNQVNLAITGLIVTYGWNIADAYISHFVLKSEQEHTPVKAAYRSAILPGLGQAYNKKYWKIPLVYAGFGVGAFFIRENLKQRNRYRDEYLARNRPGYAAIDNDLARLSDDNLLTIKREYDRLFQTAILGTTAWYILNILDATIDAHLYNFDVSDDLSLQVQPYITPTFQHNGTSLAGGLGLQFRF